MTTLLIDKTAYGPKCALAHGWPGALVSFRAIMTLLSKWTIRPRNAELLAFDDRMLKDIGLDHRTFTPGLMARTIERRYGLWL